MPVLHGLRVALPDRLDQSFRPRRNAVLARGAVLLDRVAAGGRDADRCRSRGVGSLGRNTPRCGSQGRHTAGGRAARRIHPRRSGGRDPAARAGAVRQDRAPGQLAVGGQGRGDTVRRAAVHHRRPADARAPRVPAGRRRMCPLAEYRPRGARHRGTFRLRPGDRRPRQDPEHRKRTTGRVREAAHRVHEHSVSHGRWRARTDHGSRWRSDREHRRWFDRRRFDRRGAGERDQRRLQPSRGTRLSRATRRDHGARQRRRGGGQRL